MGPHHHKLGRITRSYTNFRETTGVAYCPSLTVCGLFDSVNERYNGRRGGHDLSSYSFFLISLYNYTGQKDIKAFDPATFCAKWSI